MTIEDLVRQLIAEGYSQEDARRRAQELLSANDYEYDVRSATERYVKDLMAGGDGIPQMSEEEARRMAEENRANILANYSQNLDERDAQIRARLAQIRAENADLIERTSTFTGGNYSELGIGEMDNTEREALEAELQDVLDKKKAAFEEKRQILIAKDKERRNPQPEPEEVKVKTREELLEEANQFFSHLNTSTSSGYDISGLSENELLEFYNDFKTNPIYHTKTLEVLSEMEKTNKDLANSILEDVAAVEIPTNENVEAMEISSYAQALFDRHPERYENVEGAQRFVNENPELAQAYQAHMEAKQNKVQAPVQQEQIQDPDCVSFTQVQRKSGPRALVDKFIEKWNSSNKFKLAVIAGAAVVIAGVAFAISTLTGDASSATYGVEVANQLSGVDPSTLAAVDPSAAQTFDLNSITEGTEVYTTMADAANDVNSLVGNEWLSADHLEAVNQAGEAINLDGMSPQEVSELANSGDYQFRASQGDTYTGWLGNDTVADMAEQQINNSGGMTR